MPYSRVSAKASQPPLATASPRCIFIFARKGNPSTLYLCEGWSKALSHFRAPDKHRERRQAVQSREGGFEMMSVTGGLVCLATLATTSAFVAPLAVRYGTPSASSSSQAALRMSSEGGDDTPLVFPRSSLAFPGTDLHCLHAIVYSEPLGGLTMSFVGQTAVCCPYYSYQ